MSEHALQDFTNWKVVLSSGMGTCLGLQRQVQARNPPCISALMRCALPCFTHGCFLLNHCRVSPHTELTLSSDLCCVAVDSRGAMVEVGLTGAPLALCFRRGAIQLALPRRILKRDNHWLAAIKAGVLRCLHHSIVGPDFERHSPAAALLDTSRASHINASDYTVCRLKGPL